jgi:RNA polymerase sigma-70 factor (ECF subfamily)
MRHAAGVKGTKLTTQAELAALVRAVALDRDRAAFTQLFDYFGPRLKGYLIRLGSDSGTAEEIMQDAMTTLWNKAALFDPEKSAVATWLYRIARNRRIDGLRRDRLDYFDPMDAPEIASDDPNADEQIDLHDKEERIRAVLTHLPADQLALIKLAFFDGLSHSEIAARMKLPLGTVKSRIRLAFNRLRRGLEADGVTSAL